MRITQTEADDGRGSHVMMASCAAGGTGLLCVAVHQVGHSLGLAHSTDPSSIMWPWAPACDGTGVLSDEDVAAIRRLYGIFTP